MSGGRTVRFYLDSFTTLDGDVQPEVCELFATAHEGKKIDKKLEAKKHRGFFLN